MKAAELNHYLLALKLSQSELARLLPANLSNVSRWCRGVSPVPLIVARLVKLWVVDANAYDRQKRFLEMSHKSLD